MSLARATQNSLTFHRIQPLHMSTAPIIPSNALCLAIQLSPHPPHFIPLLCSSTESLVSLLMLAVEAEPADFQMGTDMVFFKADKGHLLRALLAIDRFDVNAMRALTK